MRFSPEYISASIDVHMSDDFLKPKREVASEPPCTCTQTDVDEFNADACMLCNPQSPYNRKQTVIDRYDEVLKWLRVAVEEIDQAHAELRDIDRSWAVPANRAYDAAMKLVCEVKDARDEYAASELEAA